jgi:hypothetical protein
VAYNLTYTRVYYEGIRSSEAMVTVEGGAAIANRSMSTLDRAIAQGTLAVTRVARFGGRNSERLINMEDLKYYISGLGHSTRPDREGEDE